MAEPQFDRALALVYDPVALNRNSTRNVLHSIGFREIQTVTSVEEIGAFLRHNDPDLLVCEITEPTGEVLALLQRIRRGETGRNPFLVIMATAWVTAENVVRQILNAGADDLMMRPFSIRQFIDRLTAHVTNRKGFVVTADYIGPDRRLRADRDPTASLINVPNSLRMKTQSDTTADMAAAQASAEIERVRFEVSFERMKREAFQLGILASFLEQGVASGDDPELIRADTLKALRLATELARKAAEGSHEAIADLCKALERVLVGLRDNIDPPKNAKLAGQIALAMQATLSPDRDESAHAAEISSAIAKIKANGRATA